MAVLLIFTFTILVISQAVLIVMEANKKLAIITIFVVILSTIPPILAKRKLKKEKSGKALK
jgi:hypothetical protein